MFDAIQMIFEAGGRDSDCGYGMLRKLSSTGDCGRDVVSFRVWVT
jgi:hypothetical protein